MAEPNPQPAQEEATPQQPVKVKGGGVMGPIVAAIIIVAGIAVIMKIMVLPVLEKKGTYLNEGVGGDGGVGKQDKDESSQASKTNTRLWPFDLGEPILVNIEGQGGKVLSAKVGYMLKTIVEMGDEETKLLEDAVGKFKPLLRDGVRGYLTSIQEDELELVTVHKEQLRRRMNDEFDTIRNRSREPKIKEFINSNPVERVLLPSFTAQ